MYLGIYIAPSQSYPLFCPA